MKKVYFLIGLGILFLVGIIILKDRKMDADNIVCMSGSCSGREQIECYESVVIKEVLTAIDELPKKRISKKPEIDDAGVMSLIFTNERNSETEKVEFTYLQKKIYLGIDYSWYETEMSLEDVWALYDSIECKEKD